jgi:hypothetical protein
MLAFLLWLASLLSAANPALPLEASSTSGPPVQGCDGFECGNSNGTRMTGLAVDVTGDIRTITLSSREVLTLQ